MLKEEISRFMLYFFTHGGKMEATVLSTRPKPSPISSGGLEIMLKAKLIIDEKHGDILKHLRQLIEKNYDPDINDTEKNEEGKHLEVEVEEDFDINHKVGVDFDIGDVIFIEDEEDIEKE